MTAVFALLMMLGVTYMYVLQYNGWLVYIDNLNKLREKKFKTLRIFMFPKNSSVFWLVRVQYRYCRKKLKKRPDKA